MKRRYALLASGAATALAATGLVALTLPAAAATTAHDYIDRVTAWLDSKRLGYTAWTWNPWGCGSGTVLITDYNGTPTSSYGEGYKAHLLSVTP